ncbi:putative protein kinase RLK-Pelle-WAK family [Helianthus annuus]|uniref:Putative EGF-like domain-containing protein n=1 Tax=Helianthus annuus TaxID=4232 RepID=A0A251TG06_HELAN|nr:putative wall-associated receptor kinase-like 16 [Helianthus annuus]KAJ0877616.1 putative protein kinase RLK-Pelle-WAK family [Helianthus annuus]
MLLQLNVILIAILIAILSTTKAESQVAQSLPGCPDKCGNITIPYPFGTQKHCSLSEAYQVNCKNLSVPKANFKILNITVDGLMYGLLPVAHQCYNSTGSINQLQHNIKLSRFRISSTLNLLTAVGCHANAALKDLKDGSYISVCISRTSCNGLENGSCFGQGCMQVPLPFRLTKFRLHAQRVTTKVGSWSFNNCTYAFLVQKDQYTFHETDLDKMHNRSFPVALEWTVGNTSCKEAKKNKNSYICKENSICVDSLVKVDQGNPGYTCSCAKGYQGNAYLPHGCQDVNECEGPQNDCVYGVYGCLNTNGSYTCSCPSGMLGDGRESGSGCTHIEAKSLRSFLYIAIGTGPAASIVLTFILYWGLKQRRTIKNKEMFFKKNGGLILQKILFESKQPSHKAKIFAARVLVKATNNFHKTNVIGQGGYGTVYKGTLEDNTRVAIKKSKSIDENQIEQFINEVIMLSEVSHPNVVRLLGCCLETQTPLLVYEFVTNKTVFHHLHQKDCVSSMTFERRLNIATQTAEALAHIHSTTQIIHRDIKSSNILLTDDYTVKVSDFGISRFIPMDQTHIQTLVHGTLGYIDPEYFRSGILTEKSDVYSFGMVLVELITGRKVYSYDGTESELGLAMFFVSSLERGCLIQILDDQAKKEGISDHIDYVAKIAKDCIQLEGKKRPNMEVVKEELEKLRQSFIKSSPGESWSSSLD